MEKKEFAVGEEFQCGLIKLRVEKGGKNCNKCYLRGSCKYSITGPCSAEIREDKTDVIFVEVE